MSRLLVNTTEFRRAAIDFDKNGGKYTLAPQFSKDWWDYWEEQERRCLNGYSHGGMRITGRHYFYLNFTRIRRILGKGKTERKVESFPAFWEIDYNWFWYKEIAWFGCNHEQLMNLELWRNPKANIIEVDEETNTITYAEDSNYVNLTYGGAMHLSCLKTRRAGFSYKEAADGVYNYNFVPGSKNYYLAGAESFLIGDKILDKVEVNLDWLNLSTDTFWLKNRQRGSTLMHQVSSFVDNRDKITKGFKSEIIGQVVADPEKVRGADGFKVVCEEAGSFKHLKKALGTIIPSLRAGSTLTGQASVFGTGGEEGIDIEGLDEIFSEPEIYAMLPFVNDWEAGFEETECGVFVPCYMANDTYMDDQGHIDIEGAIKADEKERELARRAKDPKKIDYRIAEFPRTPTEALIRVAVNNFPVNEARSQKARILHSLELQGTIKHGYISRENTGLRFYPQALTEARPVLKYPHKKKDDIEGCITIIQDPERNADGTVPDNLYQIVVDPYYDEEAEDTTSLGSVYVTKRSNNMTPTHVMDVAWFNGRPKSIRRFHEIIFLLADYYNAKVQAEVGGGGKGVYDYARINHKLHRLEHTPININLQEIKKVKSNRTYLMNMTTDDKKVGLSYYQDHLRETVGIDEQGNALLNIHFVFDLGLLDEIIKFNPLKNADRISAQILKQYMLKENATKKVKDKKNKRKRLIDRDLFGDTNDTGLIRVKDGEVYI